MSIMTINGERIETFGKNISILDDRIMVDREIVADGLSGFVEIRFEGALESFKCYCPATIHSNIIGRFSAGSSK